MSSLSKEQSKLSRETIQNAFLSELCPFFRLGTFILYQAGNSRALAPACGALVINSKLSANSLSFEESKIVLLGKG